PLRTRASKSGVRFALQGVISAGMVPLKIDEVTAMLLLAAEDGRRRDASPPCERRLLQTVPGRSIRQRAAMAKTHLSTVFSAAAAALPLAEPESRATVFGSWNAILTLNTVDIHGNGVDARTDRRPGPAGGGGASHRRDRPPPRPQQERRRRQGASP